MHIEDMLIIFTFLVRNAKAESNLFMHVFHIFRVSNVFKHFFLRFEVLDVEGKIIAILFFPQISPMQDLSFNFLGELVLWTQAD